MGGAASPVDKGGRARTGRLTFWLATFQTRNEWDVAGLRAAALACCREVGSEAGWMFHFHSTT